MKVFINPGHDRDYDSGAVGFGMRECDIAYAVGVRVAHYLEAAGCETKLMQSDNLFWDSNYADRQNACVVADANNWEADVFVSIHCNAASPAAHGTEVEVYNAEPNTDGAKLGQYIQNQIVNSLGTTDRGVKSRPDLIVLRHTDMPACLVEMAFISNESDAQLLADNQDEFARAIARGVTDYENFMPF